MFEGDRSWLQQLSHFYSHPAGHCRLTALPSQRRAGWEVRALGHYPGRKRPCASIKRAALLLLFISQIKEKMYVHSHQPNSVTLAPTFHILEQLCNMELIRSGQLLGHMWNSYLFSILSKMSLWCRNQNLSAAMSVSRCLVDSAQHHHLELIIFDLWWVCFGWL